MAWGQSWVCIVGNGTFAQAVIQGEIFMQGSDTMVTERDDRLKVPHTYGFVEVPIEHLVICYLTGLSDIPVSGDTIYIYLSMLYGIHSIGCSLYLFSAVDTPIVSVEMLLKQIRAMLIGCASDETTSARQPTALLGLNYVKKYSKILANRLKDIVMDLVNPDQSGFIPGRSGGDNTRRVFGILEALHRGKSPAIILALDAEKAFDRFKQGLGVGKQGIPAVSHLHYHNFADMNKVIKQSLSVLTFTINPVNLVENNPANEEITVASGLGNVYKIEGTVPFDIDPASGAIIANKKFNYETEARKSFTFLVLSTDGLVERDRGLLTVNILNENEPPVCNSIDFVRKKETVRTDENIAMFTQVYVVSATDEDGDPLTYTVISQMSEPTQGGLFFDVDKTDGLVYKNTSSVLDFDAGYEEFRLLIRVTDPDGRFCEGGLIIKINNLNDEMPVFEKIANDTVHVPENTLFGSIIEIFIATDRDGDTITYSFPGATSMFSLNSVTGSLVLRQSLDYDNPDNHKAYFLSVTATDGTYTTFYPFNVQIENVDEPPVCDTAISTGTGIVLSVPETFPALTTLYTILAKDPDENDHVKFEISSPSPEFDTYFSLDTETGIISTTGTPLDYESTHKKFVIAVKVRNIKDHPMFCTGLITINLLNENDEPPIFQDLKTTTVEVYENVSSGAVICTLQALDKDAGDIVHYELSAYYYGFFIDENTGEIKISYPLDYEDSRILREQRLKIHAVDNDRVHTTITEITIKLLDVNDNYPQCDGYPNVIEVAETIAVDTLLIQFVCLDKDKDAPNNVLTYKMINLDAFSADKFRLTGNRITTGPKALDYDNTIFAGMQFKHTLLIEVSDSGRPSLTSTVTLIVRVTRVNEARPESLANVFGVQENSPADSFVGKVRFIDVDWPFDNMKFTFDAGDYGNPPIFYIEPETGVIKVLHPPDFEKKNQYSVNVKAIDLNNDVQPDPLKQLRTLAVATINIINVNDEPPICVPAYYERIIYSTIKTPFLQLECSDKDSPDGQLSYSIISGNTQNRFVLQRDGANPPTLATNQNFQYNVFRGIQDPTEFQLLIEVTDEFGGNRALQLSTTATVIVHVVPWTTTLPTTATVPTTTTITTSVLVRNSYFWHPDNWFPAVITITSILFLLCLYALAWGLLKDVPKYAKFFPLCRGFQNPQKPEKMDKEPRKQKSLNNNQQPEEKPNFLPGNPAAPLFYDVRAIDPATGNHFLFNSQTGEMKWLN
ncbi:cadherin-related family member 4-like [Pelodytes ibericus]